MTGKFDEEPPIYRLLPIITSFFLSTGGILPLVEIFNNPSEKSSQIVFGLSTNRLFLVGVILFFMLFNGFVGILLLKKESRVRDTVIVKIKANKSKIVDVLMVSAVGICWLTFLDDHDFGSNQAFYQNFRPALSYFAAINLAWLFLGILTNIRSKRLIDEDKPGLQRLIGVAITFGVFVLTWIFISFTGIGVTPKYPFWGNSGTMLFGYQVIVAILITMTIVTCLNIIGRFRGFFESRSFEIGFVVILWGIAAASWIQLEPNHNFFAPTRGNQIYFPYSDAALYDSTAQSILIGEGFYNSTYTFRPLYVSFLAGLLFFSGQDYLVLIAIQAGLLAIAIPYLYLIGKRLHSRFLGVLVATLGTFLEMNAITSPTTIRVSHSKLLLTEYPTFVLLVIAAYYAIAWFQEPNKREKFFIVMVGLLTASMLIRMHTFVVLLGLLFLMFVCVRTDSVWQRLKQFFIAGVFIVLILSPWMIRNYIVVGQFSIDPGRFNLLLENRWELNEKNDDATIGSLSKQSVSLLLRRDNYIQQNGFKGFISGISDYAIECLAHFFHNEALSVLALPSSYNVFDHKDYYQSDYYLYEDWAGELALYQKIFLIINLVILSVGITSAYKRNKFVGLVPLLIQILYTSSNALVRTSGWRYIKPIEWVILIYFAYGIIEILTALRNIFQIEKKAIIQNENCQRRPYMNLIWADIIRHGYIFILVPILISFGPLLIPQRYSSDFVDSQVGFAMEIIQDKTQFNAEQIQAFLSTPGSVISVGRVLYPRFLGAEETLHHKPELPFYFLGINRIEFVLLNQQTNNVFFPTPRSLEALGHASDVVVWGCLGDKANDHFIEAVLIIVFNQEGPEIIFQDGLDKLDCPISDLSASD